MTEQLCHLHSAIGNPQRTFHDRFQLVIYSELLSCLLSYQMHFLARCARLSCSDLNATSIHHISDAGERKVKLVDIRVVNVDIGGHTACDKL